MGNTSSVTWRADQDSISRPGEKAIVTDPIEGMTGEDFFKIMQNYVRERPPNASMYEVSRDIKEADGAIMETLSVEVSGIGAMVVGDIKMKLHNKYYTKPDEFVFEAYMSDATYKDIFTRATIKAHMDPFRLEALVDDFETRRAGPMMQGLIKKKLANLGYDVAVEAEAPSPSEPGKKSIVSAEIPDAGMSVRSLWEKLSASLEADETGTALPDGSVVVEQSSLTGLGQTNFFKWVFDEKEGLITCLDFGADENMDVVAITSFWKVIDSPKRIEAWATTSAGRQAGVRAQKTVEELVGNAMKLASEKGS